MSLKSQLKTETTTSKKSIREMGASLAEASARTQKSEREYAALRDSFKGLVDGFKSDNAALRDEMRKREEKVRAEATAAAIKYAKLAEQVKKDQEEGGSTQVKKLLVEHLTVLKEIEENLQSEVAALREDVGKSGKDNEQASKTAKSVTLDCAVDCLLTNRRDLFQSSSGRVGKTSSHDAGQRADVRFVDPSQRHPHCTISIRGSITVARAFISGRGSLLLFTICFRLPRPICQVPIPLASAYPSCSITSILSCSPSLAYSFLFGYYSHISRWKRRKWHTHSFILLPHLDIKPFCC